MTFESFWEKGKKIWTQTADLDKSKFGLKQAYCAVLTS